jgi:sugar lactone lactonase YvrE
LKKQALAAKIAPVIGKFRLLGLIQPMKKLFVSLAICVASQVLLMAQPVITNQPGNLTVTNGGTAIFTVGVSGKGPFTYQWQFNGTNLPNSYASGLITTVVGTGGQGFAGDGGAATNAKINWPGGLAFDASGNLFIADQYNYRIRRMDQNGQITTIAGTGTNGYYGDGGPATNANLGIPSDMVVDGMGNLIIADANNNRIRLVDTNGNITTIAGTGSPGPDGDGGPATAANLHDPWGVAMDSSGNLYIGDQFNNRVRCIDTNGIITTVAGNGNSTTDGDGGPATNASVQAPVGLACDQSGNLYIVQYGAGRVRRVDTNGIISTFAGGGAGGGTDGLGDGGAATNATLNEPYTLAFDASGNLLVSEWGHSRVRQIDTNGIITCVAGTGSSSYSGDGGAASLAGVNALGVALDASGNLFVSDYFNQRIRKVALTGPSRTVYNVGVSNIGNYQVVISNFTGSVTSSVATLSILPQTATATAVVLSGFVVGINLTSGGFGYTNIPTVHIIGSSTTSAQVTAIVSNGVVVGFNILNAGSGYTTPQIVIDPPVIPNPLWVISKASFLTFTNLILGTNYQLQQIQGWYWTNLGAGFTATNSFNAQGVSSMVATNYRLATSPTPTQAFGTAQLFNGFVVGVTITSMGSGYTSNPPVQIIGGGGHNATAASTISGAGAVTNITMTGAGVGYTSSPTIQIAPPPAVSQAPKTLAGVRIDSTNLVPYGNYQIQVASAPGGIWTTGVVFNPTVVTNSQFLFATNTAGFFRVRFGP